MRSLVEKYKDIIPYLFFGVCTTLVNVVVYWLMAHLFGTGVMVSTIVAWIAAVLFAYVTNRKWVFHSEANTRETIVKEIISFFWLQACHRFCRLGMYVSVCDSSSFQ